MTQLNLARLYYKDEGVFQLETKISFYSHTHEAFLNNTSIKNNIICFWNIPEKQLIGLMGWNFAHQKT